MKSGDPLKRKTGIKRDGPGAKKFANSRSRLHSQAELKRSQLRRDGKPLERTPLAPRSEKRQTLMAEHRVPLIEKLIAEGMKCMIGPILANSGLYNADCAGEIQGLHERRKRSSGGSLTNPQNLLPACNSCNGLIEEMPEIIREETGDLLVVREGDVEWHLLGAGLDGQALPDLLQ